MSTTALRLHFPHVFSENIYNRRRGCKTLWFLLGVASMGAAVAFFSRSAFYREYEVNKYNKLLVLGVFWVYLFYQFLCLAFWSPTFELILALRFPIGIPNWRFCLGAILKAIIEVFISLFAAVLLYILAEKKLNDGFGLVTMGVLALHFFLLSRVLAGRVLVVPLMSVCIDISLHMSTDRYKEKGHKYLVIVHCLIFLVLHFVRNVCEMWELDKVRADHQAALDRLRDANQATVARLNARILQLEAQVQVPALPLPPLPLDHAGN